MGAMAAIAGAVGGLCLVLGIVTITGVMPPVSDQLNWSFWSTVSIILLLASIALALGRGGHD